METSELEQLWIQDIRRQQQEDKRSPFDIESRTIATGGRRLRGEWTIEAQQDLQAIYNDDEERIMDQMAEEMRHEIDLELAERIRESARLAQEAETAQEYRDRFFDALDNPPSPMRSGEIGDD
jgi:hypothetical protein